MQNAPQPYRFKSSTLRLQIPNVFSWFPDTGFTRTIRQSQVWRFLAAFMYTVRTWTRRSVWGDRLFLRFEGPANILLQSRGNSLTEALTTRDINEIADAPAGAVQVARQPKPSSTSGDANAAPSVPSTSTKLSYASIKQDGKVEFAQS